MTITASKGNQLMTSWDKVRNSLYYKQILKVNVCGIGQHPVDAEATDEEKNQQLFLMVQYGDMSGSIPFCATGIKPADAEYLTRMRLRRLIMQSLDVITTSINDKDLTFTASRLEAWEKQAPRTWRYLQEGSRHLAVVRIFMNYRKDGRSPRQHGVLLEIEGVYAYCPMSEVSHGWIEDLNDVLTPGEEVMVQVKVADRESAKLIVSIKDCLADPWPACTEKYTVGREVIGICRGENPYNVFVELMPGVKARCAQLRNGRVNYGDRVIVRIREIRLESRQILATICMILRATI